MSSSTLYPHSVDEMAYAPFLTRAAAHLIDGIILFLAHYLLWLLLAALLQFYAFKASGELVDFPDPDTFSKADPYLRIILVASYFTIFHSSNLQATPGKLLFNLQVVNYRQERLTFIQSLLRFVLYIISTLSIIGLLMAGFTKKKQALHDIICKTLVVKV